MAFLFKSASFGSQKSSVDWVGIGWLYLFFWFFSGSVQMVLLVMTHTSGFRNTLLWSFIWLIPVLLFPRWTRPISAILGIFLWTSAVISLGYLVIDGQELSESVIFTILESNSDEISEYLSQYISFSMIAAIAAFTLMSFLLWRQVRPVVLPRLYVLFGAALCVLMTFGYPYMGYPSAKLSGSTFDFESATHKLQRRMDNAALWELVATYAQYREILNTTKAILQKNASLPLLENLVDSTGDTPRTLVLVIGESTTSLRMSLYGYSRKTTPRLGAMKAGGGGS